MEEGAKAQAAQAKKSAANSEACHGHAFAMSHARSDNHWASLQESSG